MRTTQKQMENYNGPEKPQRRTLLNRLWALLGLLACIELSWLTGSILKSRKTKTDSADGENYIDAGRIESFKPGDVKAIPEGLLYVSRLDDGSFIALSRTCTHLGCAIPWNEENQKFVCPCHGSMFDRTGVVINPPAIRPLDYFPVRIENGLIRVNTDKPIKREIFEPTQVTQV